MKMRGEEMGRDERMGTRGKENRREGNRGRGKGWGTEGREI